jgi:hypothetical protein
MSKLRVLGLASIIGIALGTTALLAQTFDIRPPRPEHEAVRVWIDEVTALLRSDALASNLKVLDATYGKVELTTGKTVTKPSELTQLLRLQATAYPQLAYRPAVVVLTGSGVPDPSRDSGFGNTENASASVMPVNYRNPVLRMAIGRVHLDRYLHGNQVERSCAINTMAHEITHTLTDKPGPPFIYFFTDDAPPGSTAVATLLVGAVAQCTFLRNAGRIATDAQLTSCVAKFGTVQPFKSNSCNDYTDTSAFP